MKPGTIVLIAGAGLASLLYGNAVGLFGGVEGGGGSSKKGTVSTGVVGVTPEEIQTVSVPQSNPYKAPIPYEVPFIPYEVPFIPYKVSQAYNPYSELRSSPITSNPYVPAPSLLIPKKSSRFLLRNQMDTIDNTFILITKANQLATTKKEQAVTKTPTKFTDPGYKSSAWS